MNSLTQKCGDDTGNGMSDNPYAAPASQTLSPQNRAIWTKELNSARTILIIVGVIQLLFGIYYLSQAKSQVEDASRAEVAKAGPGYVFDQSTFDREFEERKTLIYVLTGIPVLLAVFFFVMASLVFKFPVGVTLASLIVFVTVHLADAYFDPISLAKGFILKIIFLATLWKAYQSARTARAALSSEPATA